MAGAICRVTIIVKDDDDLLLIITNKKFDWSETEKHLVAFAID